MRTRVSSGFEAELMSVSDVVQEPPIGLPALERRRQLDFVSTMAHILLIAQALGGIPGTREGPQTGQGQCSQRRGQQEDHQDDGDHQGSQQGGSGQSAPQEEPGQRSGSQDYIPLSFAQAQSGEDIEGGEIPLTRKQMRQAGTLLQE